MQPPGLLTVVPVTLVRCRTQLRAMSCFLSGSFSLPQPTMLLRISQPWHFRDDEEYRAGVLWNLLILGLYDVSL